MSTYRLDVPTLHRYLDHRRRLNGLSWRDVGRETGLASSTLSRIAKGQGIDGDTLVTLIHWLGRGKDLGPFIEPVEPVDCPACQRSYQPNRDGIIRRHGCPTEPTP